MEVDFQSSPDTSLEIPAIMEAISSSIDESCLNYGELEKSPAETSITTESDLIEYDDGWQSAIPQQTDPYNDNYFQNYQHQQPMQWNYQQQYSPYNQYGYMTPSPYNSYYMQSPPVEYHQNYMYNGNIVQGYEQPSSFTAAPKQQDSQHSCTICIRSFKSASNLTRHYMSKTHLKRLESKKQNSKVTVVRVKKPKIGSSFTDISKDERQFLWQLDDEIFNFLKEIEEERTKNGTKNNLALPTPPLSPKIKNTQIIVKSNLQPQIVQKPQSVLAIEESSERSTPSPASVTSSSSSKSPKIIYSPNYEHKAGPLHDFEQKQPQNGKKVTNDEKKTENLTPKSVVSSPAVLINENGEKFEVIFSDENFGDSVN